MGKQKETKTAELSGPFFVFGIDADGRPRGARFAEYNERALKFALGLGLIGVHPASLKFSELASKLPLGRLYTSGKGFIPNVRRDLVKSLSAVLTSPGDESQKHQRPDDSAATVAHGFLPLIWGVIDASIDASNQQAAARTMVLGFPYHPSKGLPFQIPLVVNALFGWLDELRLRKAGYGSKWMRAAAVLLIPVYLFARAKRLKQKPWYAVCWIVTFLLGIFLVAAVQAGL